MALSEKLNGLVPRRSLSAIRRSPRVSGTTLELFLPRRWPETGTQINWYVRSGASVSQGQAVDLDEIPAYLRSTHVVAWTPPADTLLTQATLPTRSRNKIMQALPFALEDQLLGDPQQLHFAYYRQDDGTLAVAVTSRERLSTWLDALAKAGLRPTRVCPANLALPIEPDSWSVAFAGTELWIRTGPFSGFVCPFSDTPPATLIAGLDEAREQGKLPSQLSVFDPPAGFDAQAWGSDLGVGLVIADHTFHTNDRNAQTPLNLLQGDFAPTGQLHQLFRPLRPAALILGIWFLAMLGFNLSEWWQLKSAYRSQQQTMTSLFQKTFPREKVILDPAAQMQRNLDALRGQSGKTSANDFLPLLAGIAPTLRSNPSVKLRSLKYGDTGLTIDLNLPDFQALEVIKNDLGVTRAFSVEVLAANSRASGVEGRLRIQRTSN